MNDRGTHFLHWHLHVYTSFGNLGFLERSHARHTDYGREAGRQYPRPHITCRINQGCGWETHYARRLWISVIAGTLLALEKGFHLFRSNHHPETESPKFRGELSSICCSLRQYIGIYIARGARSCTYRANVRCKHRTCSHGEHGGHLDVSCSGSPVIRVSMMTYRKVIDWRYT